MDFLEKLDKIRREERESRTRLDVETAEQIQVDEIYTELHGSDPDLHESDVIRAVRILQRLEASHAPCNSSETLALFYAVARSGGLTLASLAQALSLSTTRLIGALEVMQKQKLIEQSPDNEWLLTPKGRTLAEEIGIDIFF